MYPGIYSGLSYQEWKEVQKRVKAEQKKEAFRDFVESIKGSAIFYSQKKYVPGYGFDVRGIVKRIAEIVASVLFFAVIVGGLNVLALIF